MIHMIEYVVPSNIDDRILVRAARLLEEGGLVAVPTDTSWSIVCSIKSKPGIKKLKSLSGFRDERHFTLLCSDLSQFGEFCLLDNSRFRLVKRLTPGPYVFILNAFQGTEKILGLKRKEIGIRLPDHPVPFSLIKVLGFPLYSITAKRGMDPARQFPAETGEGEEGYNAFFREEELFEGGWELEDIPSLDLILDPGEDRERIFSTVLDLSAGDVRLVREGAGIWPA
jgi:tRNA threonylcarbamoyl adenosine modification protein (Sua5/YciO/YrdC/YwlC family)